ncbi:MAG: hypothetical protein Q8R58_03190 [Sulfuricurvum sp.]|nr:hypothetical protein [Sulfuricurvum sp.]
MSTFLNFGFLTNNAENFFFSLPASMAVLFFLLSVGVTALKGK